MRLVNICFKGQWYSFAKGSLWENIKLWWAGYHYHDTMIGWCMLKKVEKPEDEI